MRKPALPATGNSGGAFATGKRHHGDERKGEYFPTGGKNGALAVRALCHHMPPRLDIWEPFAGAGHIANVLRDEGHNVTCSDIYDRGCGAEMRSFFDYDEAPAPHIVTNPPFSFCNSKTDFSLFRHAVKMRGLETLLLLLPAAWDCAMDRESLFDEIGYPHHKFSLTMRPDFTGEGKPTMLTAWWMWKLDEKPKHTIGRLLTK